MLKEPQQVGGSGEGGICKGLWGECYFFGFGGWLSCVIYCVE